MTYNANLPRPIGVFLSIARPTYEAEMQRQIEFYKEKQGEGNIEELLNSGDTWKIQ
jgi:2-oxoglutarate ferredoxin oxidoreductase subunit beta